MKRNRNYKKENIQVKKYQKSKLGMLACIYSRQKRSSLSRKHKPPNYTLEDFRRWCFSQEIFHILYDKWKNSGYQKKLRPSCDRLDDYKGYFFGNIQITTWEENNRRSHRDCILGINKKRNKEVSCYSLNGKYIKTYFSMAEAGRKTKADSRHILDCCKFRRNTAGGFKWAYGHKHAEEIINSLL